MLDKFLVRSKDELIRLSESDNEVQTELSIYFEQNCWGRTKMNTFDGYYCLKDYPLKGKHTFLYKERGAIHYEINQFASYSECLIHGIFGKTGS